MYRRSRSRHIPSNDWKQVELVWRDYNANYSLELLKWNALTNEPKRANISWMWLERSGFRLTLLWFPGYGWHYPHPPYAYSKIALVCPYCVYYWRDPSWKDTPFSFNSEIHNTMPTWDHLRKFVSWSKYSYSLVNKADLLFRVIPQLQTKNTNPRENKNK